MSVQVPGDDQFVVFWIDPVLTLSSSHPDSVPDSLLEEAKKQHFKKYVGYITGVSIKAFALTLYKSNETEWQIHSVVYRPSSQSQSMTMVMLCRRSTLSWSHLAPDLCPELSLTSRLNISLGSARKDSDDEPIQTSEPLPWSNTFILSMSNIGILSNAVQSTIAPISILNEDERDRFDDLRRDHIARWRRARYPWNLTSDDSDLDESDEEQQADVVLEKDPEASSGDLRPYELMLDGIQGRSGVVGVEISTDLSLVENIPDPMDFYREQLALQELEAEITEGRSSDVELAEAISAEPQHIETPPPTTKEAQGPEHSTLKKLFRRAFSRRLS